MIKNPVSSVMQDLFFMFFLNWTIFSQPWEQQNLLELFIC